MTILEIQQVEYFFVFYLLKGKLEWPDARLGCSNWLHTKFECIIQRKSMSTLKRENISVKKVLT